MGHLWGHQSYPCAVDPDCVKLPYCLIVRGNIYESQAGQGAPPSQPIILSISAPSRTSFSRRAAAMAGSLSMLSVNRLFAQTYLSLIILLISPSISTAVLSL